MSKPRRLAYLALLYNALVWGAAFPVIKPVFEILSPTQYLYLRFLTAGVIGIPIFLYFYLKLRPKISYIIKVLLLELIGLPLPLYLLYTGLSQTSALESSLIGATGPIFVIIGGILFLRERESRREWQGLSLSLFGSLLLILEPLWNGQSFIGSSLGGNLYVLGYNLLYAIYAVAAKKFYAQHPPLYFGALTYLGTALIYGLILNRASALPPLQLLYTNSSVLFPVIYMALPGGIIAFALYLYAQSKIEVSEANLFTYLNGVVAIPAAYLLLGETPTPTSILAIIVIAYGVYYAQTHQRTWLSRIFNFRQTRRVKPIHLK